MDMGSLKTDRNDILPGVMLMWRRQIMIMLRFIG